MAVGNGGGSTQFHIGFITMERQDIMKMARRLPPTLLMTVTLLGAVGCNHSSITGSDHVPTISNLQVQGTQIVSERMGLLLFSFDYVDQDADINSFVFRISGETGLPVVNQLPDAGHVSGTASVAQTITFPAPGTEVDFSVTVRDHNRNESNSLSGTFTAP